MKILFGKVKRSTRKAVLFVDGTSEESGWIPKSAIFKIEEIGASRRLFGLAPEVEISMTDRDYSNFGSRFEAQLITTRT